MAWLRSDVVIPNLDRSALRFVRDDESSFQSGPGGVEVESQSRDGYFYCGGNVEQRFLGC